jgi:hypothetical protein
MFSMFIVVKRWDNEMWIDIGYPLGNFYTLFKCQVILARVGAGDVRF